MVYFFSHSFFSLALSCALCMASFLQLSHVHAQSFESPIKIEQLSPIHAKSINPEDLVTVYYFDDKDCELSQTSKKLLTTVALFLKNNPEQKIVIVGHSDIHGSRDYNLSLSQQRASSVATYLESQGVSSQQLTTISKGKEMPTSLENNPQAQALNRRVEIFFERA